MSPTSTTRRPGRGRQVLSGLFALAVLLGALVGVPVLLAVLGGNPLPDQLPSAAEVGRALTSPDDGTLFLRVLTVVGWLGWATFALSVLVEVPAAVRRRPAPRLPGLRTQQRVAATLIAAVALIGSSSAVATAASTVPVTAGAAVERGVAVDSGGPGRAAWTGTPQAAPGAEARQSGAAQRVGAWEPPGAAQQPGTGGQRGSALPQSDTGGQQAGAGRRQAVGSAPVDSAYRGTAPWSSAESRDALPPLPMRATHAPAPAFQPVASGGGTYVVAPGDRLSDVAGRFLGDPDRYPELARANGLSDADEISPGQRIVLPGGVRDRGASQYAAGPVQQTGDGYVVAPGDRLSDVAERFLGDADRYPELATGSGLEDPDELRPGQQIQLPPGASDRGAEEHATGRVRDADAAPAAPGERSPGDRGPADSGSADSGSADPGAADRGAADRGAADSGSADPDAKAPVPGPTAPSIPAPRGPAPSSPVPSAPTPSAPNPSAPAPGTPAPAIPAPAKPAPASPVPGVPAPGRPGPGTGAPGTAVPTVPAPASPAPESPAPGVPAPGRPAPGTGAPGTAAPTVPVPASPTPAPTAPAPGGSAPGAPAPGGADRPDRSELTPAPGGVPQEDETRTGRPPTPAQPTPGAGAPTGASGGADPSPAPDRSPRSAPRQPDRAQPIPGPVTPTGTSGGATPVPDTPQTRPTSHNEGLPPLLPVGVPLAGAGLLTALLLARGRRQHAVVGRHRRHRGQGKPPTAAKRPTVVRDGFIAAPPRPRSPVDPRDPGVPRSSLGSPALTTPTANTRLDAALRGLSTVLADRAPDEMPDVTGAWIEQNVVRLVLDRPCPRPPAPWTGTELSWELPADAELPDTTGVPAPLPMLVTVGTRGSSALLLDVERLGVLTLTGDAWRADDLLRYLGAELAGSPWSDDLEILVAGLDSAQTNHLAMIGDGRIEPVPSVADGIGRMRRRVSQALGVEPDARGRHAVAEDDEDEWAPTVLLAADPDLDETIALGELDAELATTGRCGVGVIASIRGDLGRWPLNVTEEGAMSAAFLRIREPDLLAARLSPPRLGSLAELFVDSALDAGRP